MLGAARAERADRLLSPPSLPRQVVGYRLGAVQADRQSRSRRRASPAEKNQHYCSGHARRIGTAGPAGGFPPASLVAILVAGRAGPTWDSCALALRDWQQFVMRRAERAHRDPGQAGHFLATRAKSDAGSVQSTMRICAAPSQLAGVPSPLGNATVGAFRPGKPSAAQYAQFFAAKFLRLKCHRTCFRTRAPRDGSCDWGARLSNRPGRGPRRLIILHCCLTPRRVTENAVRGGWVTSCSKTAAQPSWVQVRPWRSVQPTARPAGTDRAQALLVNSVRHAMERLLAALPEVLATLARGFAAAGRDRHPPGPAAWPAAVQALAHRRYGTGVPEHRLPIFGPRLIREVTPSLQLAGALSPRAPSGCSPP